MNEDKIKRTIAQNLSEIRDKQHLTQKQAADKAGLNMNYYAKVERGESMPSVKTLKKLSDAFSVESTDILGF